MKIPNSFAARVVYALALFLFSLGVFLMLLNIAGLVIPYRSPDVYSYYGKPDMDVVYSYEETMAQIHRLPGESDEEYVPRLATLISNSISPYWTSEEIDRFRVRVPAWENYILYAYSYINPNTYLRYEYYDYRKALERGVGLCSQYALVTSQVLEENGIESRMLGLSGHVVTMAKVNGEWIIVDSQYDRVIPYSLEVVEQQPEIIEAYYKDTWAPSFVPEIYATAEDNKIIASAAAYAGARKIAFERWAYRMVWLIPLGLMIPFVLVQGAIGLLDRRKERQYDARIGSPLAEDGQ